MRARRASVGSPSRVSRADLAGRGPSSHGLRRPFSSTRPLWVVALQAAGQRRSRRRGTERAVEDPTGRARRRRRALGARELIGGPAMAVTAVPRDHAKRSGRTGPTGHRPDPPREGDDLRPGRKGRRIPPGRPPRRLGAAVLGGVALASCPGLTGPYRPPRRRRAGAAASPRDRRRAISRGKSPHGPPRAPARGAEAARPRPARAAPGEGPRRSRGAERAGGPARRPSSRS